MTVEKRVGAIVAAALLGACAGADDTGAAGGAGGVVTTGGAGGVVTTGGSGGIVTTGGSGGVVATGGSGGVVTTGGSGGALATGGGGSTADASANGAEKAIVSSWLTNTTSGLESWVYGNIKKSFATPDQFDGLVNAIVNSCAAFAPAAADWQRYCEAVIASAIVSESSYNPLSVVNSPANDPTVGLLQVRFSSTVQDYNFYGPPEKMAAIGCTWPAALSSQTQGSSFWSTAGATTYLGFMQDVACNIGLATWYYFINATGNGGSSPVYAYAYCQGKGVAGTMVIGLLSHLQGPAGPHPPDPTNSYVTGIKARFEKLLGGLPSPDPFAASLSPERTKFCR